MTEIDPDWKTGFVSVNWLVQNIHKPNLRVLDATWSVTQPSEDLPDGYIPKATIFDLGHLKSVTNPFAAYPDTLSLLSMLNTLGIKETNEVVIYDRHGFFSAPRVWWSLKTLGHKNVAVLQDGLPAWIKAGHETVATPHGVSDTTNYEVSPSLVKGVTIKEVVKAIGTTTQIVDARSAARFYGTSPEPRAGLRSGHIPGSKSLPLIALKTPAGELLGSDALRQTIEDALIDLDEPIITTCGSGVTAAALALIFQSIGKEDVSVYSGSWTEYGASDYPVETS